MRKFWNQVWHTPVIPAVRRVRQENCCEFEANLNYTVWASLAYRIRTCLKKKKPKDDDFKQKEKNKNTGE